MIAWTINTAYTVATRVADPLVGGMPASLAAVTAAAGCASDRRAICGSQPATRHPGRSRRI